MATFEENYIGKGSKVKDLDIVRVSISRETLEKIIKSHLVNYEGHEIYGLRSSGAKRSRPR